MRIYFFEWNKTNPMHALWNVMRPKPEARRAECIGQALDLSYFTSKSKCKFINVIHTRQRNKIICSCLWRIIKENDFKMPLNLKNINNFTQWKKWISLCDVHRDDHAPKAVWAQSRSSTRSAVDIFKELIREQEITLECWMWFNELWLKVI